MIMKNRTTTGLSKHRLPLNSSALSCFIIILSLNYANLGYALISAQTTSGCWLHIQLYPITCQFYPILSPLRWLVSKCFKLSKPMDQTLSLQASCSFFQANVSEAFALVQGSMESQTLLTNVLPGTSKRLLGVLGASWGIRNKPIPYDPCMVYYLQNWVIFRVNVGKYTIHGAYGNANNTFESYHDWAPRPTPI